ncbi:MAG: MMPL family transporter [Campylobacteraceae bacterium]|nr:MMPL family transporter [Campylobacteraceae bacterium]
MLEDDADLQFTNKMSERYGSPDFLVIAFRPNEPLLSPSVNKILTNFSHDLESLTRVSSVTSILNVPLLQSPVKPIKELVKGVSTWGDSNIDATLIKEEFLNSPLYKSNLVSEDFTITALILSLKPDKRYEDLLSEHRALLSQSSKDYKKIKAIERTIKSHRDSQREIEHQGIKQVRTIMSEYQEFGDIYLGGVSMIADDMITYIKHDVFFYGITLFGLLSFALFFIFRQVRWVVLPALVCIYSVAATTGVLGYFGWEVTVISSNFVALQLIVTLSIVIHLIVRYRELAALYTKSSQSRLVYLTMLSKATPTFFSVITTIAGFGSLVFSNIKPIISLGWMMSIGIAISLILGFVLFGALLSLLPKKRPLFFFETHIALAAWCSSAVKNYGKTIFVISLAVFVLGASGAIRLEVENSFIDYFKSSTEIHKGMAIIDKNLGGTTPLDVIVTFKENVATLSEELDPFEAEFAQTQNQAQYWFSTNKIKTIEAVHEYLESKSAIGNVQSIGTLLKIGKILNNGRSLDSFEMALLYNELPNKFRHLILDPYLSIEHNQIRFATRIIDSMEGLRRDALLKTIDSDLNELLKDKDATHRLSSLMVLYNNLLQSLFESQIRTLGFVVLILGAMFWLLFRNLRVAFVALVANIIPISAVFGFMGWLGLPLDMMTITIAAISIGIGVDDTIHYLHRFYDELVYDGNYVDAMVRAHKGVGYAMYYTSFVVMLGFSVLVVSNFIPTIYFGLLTVLVMAMALLGALLLLPQLLLLVRPWNVKLLRKNNELSS